MRRFARVAGCAVTAMIFVACAGTRDLDASYVVAFQSTSEAIAASDLRVFVFDASTIAATEPCLELLELRESGQDLPATVLEVGPTSTCAVAQGGGAFDVPFAQLAVLVVAEGASGDFALGCAVHAFTSDDPGVTITLALAPGQTVPATKCGSLAEHCSGGC